MGSALEAADYHSDHVFSSEDLSGTRIEGKVFEDCVFSRCTLLETVFASCRFVECVFEACDASLMQVLDCSFTGCRFEESKAISIDWTRAAWPKVTLPRAIGFFGCTIDYSTFLGLTLGGFVVKDCVAREADFREADLTGADFEGTDLAGSLFFSTNLTKADLSRARNYRIAPADNRLSGAKFSLPEVMALLEELGIDLVE